MWDESLIIIMQMQNFRTKGGKFENVISTHVHYHVMFKIFRFLCVQMLIKEFTKSQHALKW